MQSFRIVTTRTDQPAGLRSTLGSAFPADFLTIADLPRHPPSDVTVLDLDFRLPEDLRAVRQWLRARPGHGQVIVAIDDKASRLQLTQACALGATAILTRPLTVDKLRRTLFRGADAMTLAPAELREEVRDLSADFNALQEVLTGAAAGRLPDIQSATIAGERIVERIEEIGLRDYLSIVRNHHGSTYRHCLSVTAIAVAFAGKLGFNRSDMRTIALSGLLHDIGKARIPLDILEKEGALDEHQAAIMRTHPDLGHELLRSAPALSHDVLDMVLHHHEYLDGSGYPHGLKDAEISDLCRLITISDVYGALIERRSYKPALSGPQAFQVLEAMGPQLDAALVGEFQPLSRGL